MAIIEFGSRAARITSSKRSWIDWQFLCKADLLLELFGAPEYAVSQGL
jgi:hypothetical protein